MSARRANVSITNSESTEPHKTRPREVTQTCTNVIVGVSQTFNVSIPDLLKEGRMGTIQ